MAVAVVRADRDERDAWRDRRDERRRQRRARAVVRRDVEERAELVGVEQQVALRAFGRVAEEERGERAGAHAEHEVRERIRRVVKGREHVDR